MGVQAGGVRQLRWCIRGNAICPDDQADSDGAQNDAYVRSGIDSVFSRYIDGETGVFDPGELQSTAATVMLEELLRWTDARRVCEATAEHLSGVVMDNVTRSEQGAAARHANRLLRVLPDDVYHVLEQHMRLRNLERGEILHRPGEEIRDLYFPIDCLISVTVTMRDNRTVEAGVVGSREMVGINAFMGGRETTQTEYIVQIPGSAIQVAADPIRKAFDSQKKVRDIFLKYTQAMIAQISQSVACNSVHSVEQRYARWLLEVYDRLQQEQFKLTHEFIAEMLGVRRAGITVLAGKFERDGILEAGRGWTRVIDAERLKAASCECYSVLKEEYDRLLGDSAHSAAHQA
jgi:CRP-like cAMP-binding protein